MSHVLAIWGWEAMTPLVVVAIWIAWLRFKIGARLRNFGFQLVAAFLEEHGTKTLFNGQPVRPVRPPAMNRRTRRARRWEMLHGR